VPLGRGGQRIGQHTRDRPCKNQAVPAGTPTALPFLGVISDQLGLSKKQLNRRGRLTRDFMNAFRAGDEDTWQAFDQADVFAAMDVVEAYRAAHAKPLRRVNAGLRYYVKKAGMSAPDVTQRPQAVLDDRRQAPP